MTRPGLGRNPEKFAPGIFLDIVSKFFYYSLIHFRPIKFLSASGAETDLTKAEIPVALIEGRAERNV